jgi:hypothetical protein
MSRLLSNNKLEVLRCLRRSEATFWRRSWPASVEEAGAEAARQRTRPREAAERTRGREAAGKGAEGRRRPEASGEDPGARTARREAAVAVAVAMEGFRGGQASALLGRKAFLALPPSVYPHTRCGCLVGTSNRCIVCS